MNIGFRKLRSCLQNKSTANLQKSTKIYKYTGFAKKFALLDKVP